MKKIYFLGCLFVLSVSCQKDEIAPPISDIELQNQERVVLQFDNLPENIQQYFDEDFSIRIPGKKQNSPFGKINKNIKAKKVRLKNGITTYTFALLTNSDDIEKSQEGYYFDNLVIKENEDEDELYVIRYEPTQEWLNTGHDFGNFQGIITLFSLNGEKLNSIDTINLGSSGETNKEVCPAYLVSVTYSCSGMESSSTQSCYWIYTYEVSCPAGGTTGTSTGGGDAGDGIPDPASIPTEPTEDWDYGAGGGTDTSNTAEQMVVEITVDLEGKELCAYNRLQWAGVNPTNSYMNMMTQLFIEFGEGNIGDADLVIREGDLGYRGGGTERGDEDGEYHIILSGMGNSSSIEIAKTLVHEMAHAFLAKKYDLHNKSFKELYGIYMNEQGLANYSHNIMEDHFINRMAQVLYDYDPTLFSSMDDYKIFASYGVYELNEDQLADYNLLVDYANIYDERCRDGN